MAEETTTDLVSTVGTLACTVASCNIVKTDENGVVVLSAFPKTTGGITLGGGGYIPGQGIVIGEGNSLVGEGSEWASNIVIGCNACVGIDGGYYSFDNIAIGNGAKAINGFSVALGGSASASGSYSTALGYSACASGCSSMALGSWACAKGVYSTALGYYARATGYGALAIGYEVNAAENEIVLKSRNEDDTACNVLKVSSAGVLTLNGKEVGGGGLDISNGIVIGEDATVTCTTTSETFVDNVAIGTGAVANQGGAIAIGCSIASGVSSVAMGYCAEASGEGSTALGPYATTSWYRSTALGYRAETSGSGALAMGNCAQAAENEIVLRSVNATYQCCNVLKVSSTGVMTLNSKCMLPLETLTTAANTITKFTDAELTGKDYSLGDVATKLNQLLTALQELSL